MNSQSHAQAVRTKFMCDNARNSHSLDYEELGFPVMPCWFFGENQQLCRTISLVLHIDRPSITQRKVCYDGESQQQLLAEEHLNIEEGGSLWEPGFKVAINQIKSQVVTGERNLWGKVRDLQSSIEISISTIFLICMSIKFTEEQHSLKPVYVTEHHLLFKIRL